MPPRSSGLHGQTQVSGTSSEFQQIVEDCYEDLRNIARWKVAREPIDNSMDATPLLHEAYVRIRKAELPVRDRHHLLAIMTHAMNRTLVDRARRRHCSKRGGGQQRVQLSEELGDEVLSLESLALYEALAHLAVENDLLAEVVAFRYFGFTVQETAEALHVSPRTVDRRWEMAKAWLHRDMTESREARKGKW